MSAFSDLSHLRLWVAWRYEERDGKQTKAPINGMSGRHARSDDPNTWYPRHIAETHTQEDGGCAGVGINLAELGNGEALVGIDLDTCRDKGTGEIADWARAVVERVGSYAEISPSDTGLKVFGRVSMEDRAAIQAAIGGKGKKWVGGSGEYPPAIELYTEGFYVPSRIRASSSSQPRILAG